jgi:hypothetical protein
MFWGLSTSYTMPNSACYIQNFQVKCSRKFSHACNANTKMQDQPWKTYRIEKPPKNNHHTTSPKIH